MRQRHRARSTGPRKLRATSVVAAVVAATALWVGVAPLNADEAGVSSPDVEFVDITRASGIRAVGPSGGAYWADVDADGFPDLWLPNPAGAPLLFVNSGDSSFERVVIDGVDPLSGRPTGAGWADVDSDGDGELLQVAAEGTGALWSLEAGAIRADAEVVQLPGRQSQTVRWVDVDGDGLLDVYIGAASEGTGSEGTGSEGTGSEGTGPNSGLLIQREGSFRQALVEGFTPIEGQRNAVLYRPLSDDELQLLTGGEQFPTHVFALGSTGPRFEGSLSQPQTEVADVLAGDLDGDQIDDLLLLRTAWGAEYSPRYDLLVNRYAQEWTSRDAFDEPTDCRSGTLADFDNDMDLDAFLVCATAESNLAEMLFINDGSGHFNQADLDPMVGESTGAEAVAAAADLDRDGFVDLVLAPVGPSTGGPSSIQVLRNVPNDNHWLEVQLAGKTSNRDGIGAVVTALSGGTTQRRDVRGGGHRLAQDDSLVHFGLGQNDQVDRLVVTWPSGRYQVIDNVGADQILMVREPSVDSPFAEVSLERLVVESVVEQGSTVEIGVDVRNIGTGDAQGARVLFGIPGNWEPQALPGEATIVGTDVQWSLLALQPGQTARLTLVVIVDGEPGPEDLEIAVTGPFPTQRLSREVTLVDGGSDLLDNLLLGSLIALGVLTVGVAVWFTVRRARRDDLDDSWYYAAEDLSDLSSADADDVLPERREMDETSFGAPPGVPQIQVTQPPPSRGVQDSSAEDRPAEDWPAEDWPADNRSGENRPGQKKRSVWDD